VWKTWALSSFGQASVSESDMTEANDGDVVPVVPTVSHWSTLYSQVWPYLCLACTVKSHHYRQHLEQFLLLCSRHYFAVRSCMLEACVHVAFLEDCTYMCIPTYKVFIDLLYDCCG